MTKSTFYTDGYRDRMNNRPISTPDVNVYKNEYLNGYRDACTDMAKPAFKQVSRGVYLMEF